MFLLQRLSSDAMLPHLLDIFFLHLPCLLLMYPLQLVDLFLVFLSLSHQISVLLIPAYMILLQLVNFFLELLHLIRIILPRAHVVSMRHLQLVNLLLVFLSLGHQVSVLTVPV